MGNFIENYLVHRETSYELYAVFYNRCEQKMDVYLSAVILHFDFKALNQLLYDKPVLDDTNAYTQDLFFPFVL